MTRLEAIQADAQKQADRAAWNRILRALVSAHNASGRQCKAVVRLHSAAVTLALQEHAPA